MIVVKKTNWPIHWGGIGGGSGIDGQLTHCQRDDDGLEFYVRENIARNHFVTSSNERLGMKRGDKGNGVEVLELCCDSDQWDSVAELVESIDTKKRRVRRNRNFTRKWAEQQFRLTYRVLTAQEDAGFMGIA